MALPARISRPADLGAYIKARREELGWDQQTLASRLGVNRRWVWSVESGKPKVQLELVLRCLNELQTQLWVGTHLAPADPSVQSMASQGREKPSPIDINQIADMGLADKDKGGAK